MGNGFNLADVLGAANKLDVGIDGREQIEYIDIDLIDPDPDNFYELSDIDGLAANIELVGLQQPLRVRSNPDVPGHVMAVSGHRRRAALKLLVNEGKEDFRSVACIREAEVASAALRELRLIYANSDTRRMSSADISRQTERVEALLYQLKEEGVEFPGRMRDHVAEACKVSKSKLSRLKVIRDNLDFSISPFYEKGQVSESVAYKFAQQPKDVQLYIAERVDVTRLSEWSVDERVELLAELESRTCKKSDSGTCANKDRIYSKVFDGSYSYKPCKHNKCCSKCSELASCKSACPLLADKIKKLKADKKEAKRQEKLEQEERDRPKIEKIQDMWMRFGYAREQAHISVKETFSALERYYYPDLEAGHIDKEYCRVEFKPDSQLPYGNSIYLFTVKPLIKAAKLFNCSTDYLLGLTDELRQSGSPAVELQTGLPTTSGAYAAKFECEGFIMQKIAYYYSPTGKFYFDSSHGHSIEAECIGWIRLPDDF